MLRPLVKSFGQTRFEFIGDAPDADVAVNVIPQAIGSDFKRESTVARVAQKINTSKRRR